MRRVWLAVEELYPSYSLREVPLSQVERFTESAKTCSQAAEAGAACSVRRGVVMPRGKKVVTPENAEPIDAEQKSGEEVEQPKPYRPRAPKAIPPDPTVLAFRQQLVPLVEKREIIQQHVRQAQRALQDAQQALANDQQALMDTEAAIQYRMNMIAQLTGQPQFVPGPTHSADLGKVAYRVPVDDYPNLMGNPNIPSNVTSIPAPQDQRYASGYVPTGPGNPRSESAVDVREDPETRQELVLAMAKARQAV